MVTAARGNDGNVDTRYPAHFSNGDVLISVSGVNNDGTINSNSSYGDGVTISSPWNLNYTTANGGTYDSFSGTSNASPMVAGVGALILSEFKERSVTAYAEDVKEILKLSAQSTGDPLHYGAGRLDAGKALYLSSEKFVFQHSTATKNRTVTTVSNPSGDKISLYYPFGVYIVQQTKRIRASIDIPSYLDVDSSWVWANAYSEGLKWGNPSYGMQGASFVSHSGTEWTFETYNYELRDIAGNYIGWYPYDPNSANIKVTILGKYKSFNVTLSSAQFLEGGSGATYEVNSTNVGSSWNGNVSYGQTIKTIPPNSNWIFLGWSDGVVDNPRTCVSSLNIYAVYKTHLYSASANATASTNQRKITQTLDGTYFMVYESQNRIWMTRSSDGTNWTNEFEVSVGSDYSINKSPSIIAHENGNAIAVVWQGQIILAAKFIYVNTRK